MPDNSPNPTEALPKPTDPEDPQLQFVAFDPKDLDDLTPEMLKKILTMMLQNLTVLNYTVAEIAKETGLLDKLMGTEDNSPNPEDHTGMYL